ncbi:hypothetical protein E1B28_011635 [Marasmius oreades]|uniref:DUF6534 domain-containing protein n=1 Tax=Marasmius oreades TaxID=181124 RepID=A0A9P7RUJ7_9AGAR|nr:uncharacterized protein E1B28_011635 [Marasmius oreades]KAG7090014.1 hypothetical protein E1B28_011635 [Marasmius oreades]
MLFAVLTIQIYSYMVKFPRDRLALKIFVWVVYILDFAQIILLHMFCWDVWVTGLGIQGGVPTPQPATGAHTMMTAIISAMVQGFFAWRVYVLKRDSLVVKITAVVIVLLAFAQCISCICGVTSYLVAGRKASSVALEVELFIFTQIWMIGAVVCDLIIAVAMTWILIIYSRASRIKRTRTIVKSLILRSVETGTVTFAFTMVNLILFWIMPHNYIYMVFDRTLSKLYSNALFLSLNARESGADVSTTNWVGDSTLGTIGTVPLDTRNMRFRTDVDAIHIATHAHSATDTEDQQDSQMSNSNKETLSTV